MTREYTFKIQDLINDGKLDKDELIRDLMMWMTEDEVKEFYQAMRYEGE